MNCRHSLVMMMIMLFSQFTQAQQQIGEELPTLELLEFLGEWEMDNGEWVDPEKFEDEDFTKLLLLTDEEDE